MSTQSKSKKELHDWFQRYYKTKLGWTEPPRLLSESKTYLAQQEQFAILGDTLVSRMHKAMIKPKPIYFSLIDKKSPNAYAIWKAANFDAILVTTKLVENIQSVCGQVGNVMTQSENLPQEAPNFMRDIWDVVPNSNKDYLSLGGLLAQVAYSFIVHHELAHLGLGHEGISGKTASSATDEASDNETSEEFTQLVDESLGGMAAYGTGFPLLRGSAIEADADFNALTYTIEFMELQEKKFANMNAEPEDSMGIVWKAMLQDKDRRWFCIAAGVTIGLYCLLDILDPKRLEILETDSHPPIPARIIVLLHATRLRYSEEKFEKPIKINDTLLFVLTLFGNFFIAKNRQAISVEDLLNKFSINEAIKRFDEIGLHYDSLSKEMNQLDSKRQDWMRFPEFLRWKWY